MSKSSLKSTYVASYRNSYRYNTLQHRQRLLVISGNNNNLTDNYGEFCFIYFLKTWTNLAYLDGKPFDMKNRTHNFVCCCRPHVTLRVPVLSLIIVSKPNRTILEYTEEILSSLNEMGWCKTCKKKKTRKIHLHIWNLSCMIDKLCWLPVDLEKIGGKSWLEVKALMSFSGQPTIKYINRDYHCFCYYILKHIRSFL